MTLDNTSIFFAREGNLLSQAWNKLNSDKWWNIPPIDWIIWTSIMQKMNPVSCIRCPENKVKSIQARIQISTCRKFCRFLGFMWISHWWMLLMLAKFGSELLIAPGGPGLPLIIGFWNGAVWGRRGNREIESEIGEQVWPGEQNSWLAGFVISGNQTRLFPEFLRFLLSVSKRSFVFLSNPKI